MKHGLTSQQQSCQTYFPPISQQIPSCQTSESRITERGIYKKEHKKKENKQPLRTKVIDNNSSIWKLKKSRGQEQIESSLRINRVKVEGTKANPDVILDEKLIDYMGENLTEVTK